MNIRIGLALGVAAFAMGCGPGGYKPEPPAKVEVATFDPNDKNALMPMRQGSQWVFAVEVRTVESGRVTRSGTGEVIYEVVESKTENGRVEALLRFTQDGRTLDEQRWAADQRGVFQLGAKIDGTMVNFSPTAQTIIPLPAEANKRFMWVGDGPTPIGQRGDIRIEGEIKEPQEVDSEMGRFSAIPVTSTTRFEAGRTRGRSESTAWFSPGVGIVRYVQETIQGARSNSIVLRLKTYTLKGANEAGAPAPKQ